MYTQQDLDEAVASGALSAESAGAFRSFVEGQRALPAIDEEHFRLITGFNDIFVSIAAAILLFAVGWIGQSIGQSMGFVVDHNGPSPIAPAGVAAVAWALALFFTAKRRMALPSILLLLAFVGGVFLTIGFTGAVLIGDPPNDQEAIYAGAIASISGLIAALGAWAHWRRFKVPITIAAGAAAAAAIVIGIVIAILGDIDTAPNVLWATMLLLGVGVFLFAMRWDSSDPARQTRRSDVAFWLHLLAAPMIVHPVFTLLGLNDGSATIGEGVVVILLYVALGLTALAIDRRALLVSALAYVLYALQALLREFGAVELNIALTALVIGSALLLLSAFWHQARAAIVRPLPDGLRTKLPHLDRPASPLPAA
jgi:uncharacterized membrane protein YfcA